jgi:transposase
MKKRYRVKLTPEQREKLEKLTRRGEIKVRKYKRASILLLANENDPKGGKSDKEIAEQVGVAPITAHRIRKRFVLEGLDVALEEKPRPGAPDKFSGQQRAEITALACSNPPEGHARWTLRLLADKVVELEIVESISHDSVDRILKKTNCNLTANDSGALAS